MRRTIKKIIILFIISISFTLIYYNQNKLDEYSKEIIDDKLDINNDREVSNIINNGEREALIKIEDKKFTVVFYDNDSVKLIFDMLPFTIHMNDMNQNEKFYNFDKSFPTNSRRVEKINSGDLMLYNSNCLVLFYENFSTNYSYTPLGYIENTEGLKEVLGKENVTVTFLEK